MFDFLNAPIGELYFLGKQYSHWLFFGLAMLTTLALMVVSLRFTYFYFIKTGTMFIFNVSREHHRPVEEVLAEHNYVLDLGIGQVWLACGFLIIVAWAATYVWPLVVITLVTLGLPLGLIYVLAYRRRRKEVFVQKLRGVTDADQA
jgi:hypothetical protein